MTISGKKNAPYFFFALTLPPKLQQQIVDWRVQNFPADNGYPIAKKQLHLVLAWLHQPTQQQITHLITQAQRIKSLPFQLSLNDAGYWPRSGQVWLSSQAAPRELLQLATLLRARAAQIGCVQPSLPFHPHITLLRQVLPPLALPRRDFNWHMTVSEFVLLSSIPGRATTQVEARFPLSAS